MQGVEELQGFAYLIVDPAESCSIFWALLRGSWDFVTRVIIYGNRT